MHSYRSANTNLHTNRYLTESCTFSIFFFFFNLTTMHQARPFHTHPWNLACISPIQSRPSVCSRHLTPRLQSAKSRCQCAEQHISHTPACLWLRAVGLTGWQACRTTGLPLFCWTWCLWRAWSQTGRDRTFSDDVMLDKWSLTGWS